MAIEELTQIPGVGPSTAEALAEAGLVDVEAVAKAQIEDLTVVPGIAAARAERLRAAAQALAYEPEVASEEAAPEEAAVAIPPSEPVAQVAAEPAESAGKKKTKQSGKKRRKAARAKLDEELSELKTRLSDLEGMVDKARRKLKKSASKKKRKQRRDELDRLKRKAKKLGKRIEDVRKARADLRS